MNASLISGLDHPSAIAVVGNLIFVANDSAQTIGLYTTSGATVNASLITGLASPFGVAVFGTSVYVVNRGFGVNSNFMGWVSQYTLSGQLVSERLIDNLFFPTGIVISADGTTLFVSETLGARVGAYNALTGAAINSSLIFGLDLPEGLALSGTTLYVAVNEANTVGAYTTSGATINASLITGLDSPFALAVAVPEPSFCTAIALGMLLFGVRRRRTRPAS